MKMRRLSTHSVARMVQWLSELDERVLLYMRNRATLFAALIGASLLLWSVVTENGFLSAEVILAGAVGYALGFVPAIAGGIFINGIEIALHYGHPLHVPTLLVQFFGCSSIAWLGHVHKMVARRAREQQERDVTVRAQIVPWTLVNEVRNSLLAMRLLLFSNKLDRNSDPNNLKLVQAELLRLESLFKELHEEQVHPGDLDKGSEQTTQKKNA
ncbi:hypothetical protein [Sulfoacidibacillus thermotolerans]|uniref:Uncharacterized protein n=1 Tax=Sulfoacidibacillus thermotolerans TaxID=1765684 RepID=A0A2U3DAR9_SULT2|nr:hypothetical protein [Sulfoacidibacillus thermotolerans]PWI58371.1 hypothetical protein BM613_03900 [Sulfoacidibacillus thermotolerans]